MGEDEDVLRDLTQDSDMPGDEPGTQKLLVIFLWRRFIAHPTPAWFLLSLLRGSRASSCFPSEVMSEKRSNHLCVMFLLALLRCKNILGSFRAGDKEIF